jgi:predicted Zn-dependent peptidase
LTYGALYPNFTQEEFDKEKAKLLEGIKAQENVTAMLTGLLMLSFGMKHPRRIHNARNIITLLLTM